MGKVRTIQCEVCGVDVEWRRGGKPKRCPEHRRKSRRAPALRAKAAQGDAEAAAELQRLGYAVQAGSGRLGVAEAQRMAVGLSVTDDPAEAAALVGLEVEGANLVLLTERARRFEALRTGKIEGLAEAGRGALALLFLRLRDVAHVMPPTMAATAIRQCSAALQDLTGGGEMIYSDITLVLPEIPVAEVTEWLKATGADPAVLAESW